MSDQYQVKDINLADEGRQMIDWAQSRMPVLMSLRKKFADAQVFKGAKIAGCIHITKETAVLVETLKACGAEVYWSGCNPLSTNDAVAAALAKSGTHIYAWHGQNTEEFYQCIEKTVSVGPNLTLDDGADLIFTVHHKYPEAAENIIGGTEETTTGVQRLRAMADDGKLLYPIYAVNDSPTKWDFDNVYGTGQSSLDGILRATSILVAGKYFVIAGYGHCGRGVALRAKGLGAKTIITEIDPVAALRASLEGHEVMTMDEAAKIGDIFITATGMKDVIVKRHFESMKNGAVVCNTGHYDCELNLKDLGSISDAVTTIRPENQEYKLKNGKSIYVLAQGRLVNLAAAEGHPSEVMDMSFSNQFLALKDMFENGKNMQNKVYTLPSETDHEIAMIKLNSMGHHVDVLTPEQISYATDYTSGT
ncbi:MAG: adenosylhomocysteinase [Deltaproteobacteria bacterium]|nr:adenosylhomocysteinase [Deltaproteobacteria bacterium]